MKGFDILVKFFKIISCVTCFLSFTLTAYASPMNDLLFNSIVNNNLEMLKVAIDNGAQLNSKDYRYSPLSVAVKRHKLEVASYLISSGAQLDKGPYGSNENKKSNLMLAVDNDDYLMAKLLIDSGENVNAVDAMGNTALSFYFYHYGPRANIVQLLVDAHIDVNKPNCYGMTPIMLFAKSTKMLGAEIECLEILIKAGANPALKDNNGKTALAHAIALNNIDAINILLPISPKN